MIDYYHPHFKDEETEVERLNNVLQVTHSTSGRVELRFDKKNAQSYSFNVSIYHNHNHWSDSKYRR